MTDIVTGTVLPGGFDWTDGIFLQKLDMYGLEEGFTLSSWEGNQYGNSVQQTADSGYIVAGYHWDKSPYNKDLMLVRYDSRGKELWMKNYGHGQYTINQAEYVEELPDGGFIVCGFTVKKRSFDMWVLRMDSQGDTLWTKTIGDTFLEEYAKQILPLPDGGYIVAGERKIDSKNFDAYIVRLGPEGAVNTGTGNPLPLPDFVLYQNFPNPFSSETTIRYQLDKPGFVKISICNILGQPVVTLVNERKDAGYHKVQWNSNKLAGGIYFCHMSMNGHQAIRKIIKTLP